MQTSAEYQDGVLTLCCFGELDHSAAAYVMRAAETAVEEYMPRHFVVDFSGLSFMDSSGIAVLLKIKQLLFQSHGSVEIVGANEQTMRVLELSGLSGMLRRTEMNQEGCEIT